MGTRLSAATTIRLSALPRNTADTSPFGQSPLTNSNRRTPSLPSRPFALFAEISYTGSGDLQDFRTGETGQSK
jgi:hypothetical protein